MTNTAIIIASLSVILVAGGLILLSLDKGLRPRGAVLFFLGFFTFLFGGVYGSRTASHKEVPVKVKEILVGKHRKVIVTEEGEQATFKYEDADKIDSTTVFYWDIKLNHFGSQTGSAELKYRSK